MGSRIFNDRLSRGEDIRSQDPVDPLVRLSDFSFTCERSTTQSRCLPSSVEARRKLSTSTWDTSLVWKHPEAFSSLGSPINPNRSAED